MTSSDEYVCKKIVSIPALQVQCTGPFRTRASFCKSGAMPGLRSPTVACQQEPDPLFNGTMIRLLIPIYKSTRVHGTIVFCFVFKQL